MVVKSNLPRLGLGMAALGRPGYINLDRQAIFGSQERSIETMQKRSNEVIDCLFKCAQAKDIVPWLDCARSYGLSEKFVGEYLRSNKIAPDAVHVSSKWGYTYVADFHITLSEGSPHEIKDHSIDNFLKQLRETDDFLGEYVDLYQIHSATFESGVLTDSRVHEALAECKKKRGWMIGLSVSSPKQGDVIAEALEITVNNERLFDSVQCTYNLLEQRPGAALQQAHDAGLDIIIKEGLANGRALRHPSIMEYSRKLSCNTDQLALAAILAQPFNPRILSGAVTQDQLKSNFRALEIAEHFRSDPSSLQSIMQATVIPSEEYWMQRSSLSWN